LPELIELFAETTCTAALVDWDGAVGDGERAAVGGARCESGKKVYDREDPLVSPINLPLAGLPPMLVQVIDACADLPASVGMTSFLPRVGFALRRARPCSWWWPQPLSDRASVFSLVGQVGQCEVLRDQVVEFSRRALAAGVDVTLQEWVDMVRRLL